ncbi:carbohydrate ABC transporter permease [Paenibacillus tarimensis]
MEIAKKLRTEAGRNRLHRTRNKALLRLWGLFRLILIMGISFVIVQPIIMKIAVAVKDKQDILNKTIFIIPEHFTLENFKHAINVLHYFEALGNTLSLSAVMMVLQAASCALAGYGFARFDFKGKNLLFAFVILTILVPPQTLMVPTYLHFRSFDFLGIISMITGKEGVNLINTPWPSIIMAMTANGLKSGLYIYIFRQFFRGMPKEIEEAALIDGAGGVQSFFRIMLPNAIPPLITVMLFAFVWQYNDVFYASLLMSQSTLLSTQVATMPANANTYISLILESAGSANAKSDPNHVAMIVDTGILLAIAPLVILYLFVQRYFVESVERTGVVG